MKRSAAVPLLLLGTLTALTGCGPSMDEVGYRQNRYASREDCLRDWGNDERDCRSSGAGGAYLGPRYIYSHGGGYPMAIDPDGTTRQLPNSYLTRPGARSTAQSAMSSSMTVRSNSSVASAGRATGATIARGGFGSTGRAGSVGG